MTDGLPGELLPLLEGLDADGRAARAGLIQDLLARGHSVQDLRDAHAADQLALLPLLESMREDGSRTLDEIAAEYGVDPDALVSTRRALGLSVDRAGAVYGAALERHAARLRTTVDAGFSTDSLIAFNYVIGAAAASIAGGARDSILGALNAIDPSGNEHVRAMSSAALAVKLTPVLTEVVGYAVEEHLREMSRRQVTAMLTTSEGVRTADVTIAFADLVGFTALGDTTGPDRLGAVAMQLEQVARTALFDGVDLIKTLGDAVMLASGSPRQMIRTVIRLRELAAEVTDLPDLRIGVAHGCALMRAGDWYGSVVNRASRLTGLARPHTVLADDAVRSRCQSPDLQWVDLGRIEVRGLQDPVQCWSLVSAGQ